MVPLPPNTRFIRGLFRKTQATTSSGVRGPLEPRGWRRRWTAGRRGARGGGGGRGAGAAEGLSRKRGLRRARGEASGTQTCSESGRHHLRRTGSFHCFPNFPPFPFRQTPPGKGGRHAGKWSSGCSALRRRVGVRLRAKPAPPPPARSEHRPQAHLSEPGK